MDLLLTIVFFSLLFLLLGVTHRAGLTILFWSLLIFVVVAGVFAFYQFVREYEQIHGVGSWSFDPFALMRRTHITRAGGMRAEDLSRLRRIMRDLDYTSEEVNAYITLLEERGYVNLNDVLILDQEIQSIVALQADGKLPSAEKTRLLRKFKDGLIGIEGKGSIKQSVAPTTPPATTPPATTPTPPPAQPPPVSIPTPVPTCDAKNLRGSQQIADIDYQLFRPTRDPALKAGCSKCVLDEFDALSPKSLVPNTVAEYTQMLLGEKRSAIDSIVSKVQSKCFPTAKGDDKAKTIKVLTEMFSVYFFAHAQPQLPAHTRNYLKTLNTKPSLLVSYHKDVGGGECRMNAAAMKERQDNLTDAVYALYTTYRLAVMGNDAAEAVGSKGSTLSDLFKSPAASEPKASSSYEDSTLTSQLDYKPLSDPETTTTTSKSDKFLTTTQLSFTEDDLKEHINAILSGSNEKCAGCIQELVTAMQYEMTEQRFIDQMRLLRHTPTKKTAFMIEFLMVYFKHFADYCVTTTEREEANINMHMYARKFLALTQLFWAVILQTAAKRADRSSKTSTTKSGCRTASLSDMYNFFYDEYYADPQAIAAYDGAFYGF